MSPRSTARLSLRQARRAALAAQGLGRRRPGTPTMQRVRAEIDRVAQFQIDSVTVAVRAHLMPLFSRLGPYDPALLERAATRTPRRLFEYWGHAASLIDVTLEPALRVRKRAWAMRDDPRAARILADHPDLAARIRGELATRGPLTARQIDHDEVRPKGHWGWNWSQVKRVLEHLFGIGTVSVADRTPSFERRYDLTERVLPAAILDTPDPSDAVAHDMLVRRAARALGVADLTALSEYFHLRRATVLGSIQRLVGRGELEPVEIAGVPGQHWLWHEARLPRALQAQALMSPFDSMVFDRRRLEGLFGTRYRIEIYVPAGQRRHGYYVYLFWLGETPAARVDLKADRRAGVLLVQAAWLEQGRWASEVAAPLVEELHAMARWLGLAEVAIAPRGDLAATLAPLV